jgi:hypothetical protein
MLLKKEFFTSKKLPMGKTLKVAADRAYDDTKSILPTEYARGVFIEHAPTAQGLKLMHLMIAHAGGALAEDRMHEIRLSDIRKIKGLQNHDKASLNPLFREIRAVTFSFDNPSKQEVQIGGFLDVAKINYQHEDRGEVKVRWWFSRLFCEIAEHSDHWTIMDRQTVFTLKSKYSILLFQFLSSLVNLEFRNSEVLTLPNLRSVLSVPDGKLNSWNDLNRYALKPAIAEINQLSRFRVEVKLIKDGRHVDAVRLVWQHKPDLSDTKVELRRPKVGRKARRDGSAETPVDVFPESGSIRYSEPWATIAKSNGNGKDINVIASDFRSWCASKAIELDNPKVTQMFSSFCSKAKI